MKTLITTLALASLVETSAVAKTVHAKPCRPEQRIPIRLAGTSNVSKSGSRF